MDAELTDFFNNMTRTFQREIEALRTDMNAQLRDVREEIRNVHAEIRGVKTEMRNTQERIGKVSDDYREARRTRDIRAISIEARLEEVERRLTDLEGGEKAH